MSLFFPLRLSAGDASGRPPAHLYGTRGKMPGAAGQQRGCGDRAALSAWFGRVGRLGKHLTLTVEDVWVKGLPHDTTVIIRWSATDVIADDGPAYRNRGIHVVKMRWGKIIEIDAHEDSQAVSENMLRQAAFGITEAMAAPIVS